MKTEFVRFAGMALLLTGLLSTPSMASRVRRLPPDKAKIEAEARQIRQMVAANDMAGLIKMLSVGEFPSKVAAAEHLGESGNESALPALKQLNKEHGGWVIKEIHQDRSGAFAVAICKILTRYLPDKEQIEALFELLEGRGPAVPESIEPARVTVNGVVRQIPRRLDKNFDVGKRVAAELDKFDDPAIVHRLRQSVNRGAAISAVWMEVREMEVESAIERCQQIARDEGGAQRYGATHCLDKFGVDAIEALHQLALEGHAEAIMVLYDQKEKPEVFELLCWHLTNNNNYLVRLRAVSPVAYVESESHRLKSLQTLIQALYDPSKSVRRSAAFSLSTRAYRHNKPYFDQIEDSLLAALKHPDADVRQYILKSVERLGYERLYEEVPEPPAIRTDLEEYSKPPLTAEQRLQAKTEPLERQAAKALKMGPPEEAVKLYSELLKLRPAHEPYQKALEKAQAYIKAAAETIEKWFPDAPYIGVKGRYSYLLATTPADVSTLKEEFDLARFLNGESFEGWSNIFGKNPKGRDQYEKALKLYEHIVEYYPENEYKVIRSKAAIGGSKLNLYRDTKACVLTYIDVYAIPTEDVVDSTDEKRNRPIEKRGDKTQAQLDFERYYKDSLRDRVIELCTRGQARPDLLNVIIERCARTDPKIFEMAKAAQTQINR